MNKKFVLFSLVLLVFLCNTPFIDTTTQSSLSVVTNDRLSPTVMTRTVGPPATWSRTYGNTSYQLFYDMAQCSDGGFALVGYTEISSNKEGYLVRVDADGNHLWNKTYGGAENDYLRDVIALSDGFLIAGTTASYGDIMDLWLIRTDLNGNIGWSQTYGGNSWEWDRVKVVASGGGYTIVSTTLSYGEGNNDVYLVHTNSAGSLQWNKTYGYTSNDEGYDLVECSGGGYAITGWTKSSGVASDMWLIRTDASGNHLWNKTYGGTSIDRGYSIVECSSGGYAIAGYTYSYGVVDTAAWLVRTDTNGNHLWNQTYDVDDYVGARDLLEYSDGGFVLAGYLEVEDKDDGLLIRTDSSGNMLWNSTYGGILNDEFSALVECSNGDLVAAGEATTPGVDDTNGWLVKTAYPLAWDPAPTDQTVPYGLPLTYDLNVSSWFSVATWTLNDTAFAISNTGVVSIALLLPYGVYGLRVSVTDAVGSEISGVFTVTIEAPIIAALLPAIFTWVVIIVVFVLLFLLHHFVLCKRK